MKKLITYLKTLWRRGLDSQRKEVGVISGEATIEHPFSTYSAPFGTCWQPSGKLHSVVRCAAMLVMLFTIGSGNVWGADETLTITGASSGHNAPWSTGYGSNTGSSTTSAGNTINLSWNRVGRMNTGIQIEKGTSKEFHSTSYPSTNNVIKSIKITMKTNTANLYGSTNGSSWTSISYTSGTAKNVEASGYKYFKVTATSRAYCVLTSIVVTYTASGGGCSNQVTITNSSTTSVSHGSFDVNKTGAQDACSALSVVVTPNPDEHYHVASVSATNPATTGTAGAAVDNGDGTYTITYSANAKGNSTISVTFEEDTKYTIAFLNNGITAASSIQVYSGEKIGAALPTLTAGDACHATSTTFAGWTTENVGSTPVHTIDVDKIVDKWTVPTGDMTLNALWATVPASATTTFAAADYTAATAPVTKTQDNISLYFDAGQIYKSGTPYTFTITSGDHYFSITASNNKVLAKLETVCNDGTYCLYSVSDGTLSPNSSTASQAVSGINTTNVECYPKSNKQIRMQTCAVYCYDNYVTSCCTQLASINGSISANNPTSVTLTWDAVTGAEKYQVKVPGSSSHDSWTDVNTTSVTVTKSCGTAYTAYFRAIDTNGSHCSTGPESTLAIPAVSYTVTSTGVTNVTPATAFPSTTCTGFSIASMTPADGYTLPSTITVVNADHNWNSSTGALTISNVTGNVTITITGQVAANFTNGETVFIQADSKDYSAWKDDACVKAYFNTSGSGGSAVTTYWLFDATDTDAGKKLFAAVVPSSGLNQVQLQRFASNCSDWWNANGTVTKASSSGVNTFRSYGSADNNVAWNGSSTTLYLYGSQNSWGSSLGTFADQGSGVWTATISNYTPDATSKDYKIKTSYNNGWIGNTGSNNNATLDGMHVGSTYNITATLDVKDHSLTMSKTFVKGTVHFDLQGHGSAISDLENVTAGSKISAPSTPSATGYDFGGWYKEPACTNQWNFGSDVVNETMTLYAKWTKHTYTITSTLNHCSSSPAIPSSYEYTGSAAGLSYTITPSSGYRLPTTITVSGTTYTWNSTTGALVLTGIITSNVTITITAVQTHTVDWYVGGSAPANKIGDDGQTTVVDHGGKIEDFPATTPDGSACDKTFVGWTDDASYPSSGTLFNDVAGSPTINADASFYAVFAEDGGSSYVLVESDLGTDWAGDYLIAYSSTVFADGRVGGTGTGGMGKQYQKANPDDKLDGKVVDVDWGDTYHVTLEEISSNSNTYLLKTQDGLYNYVSGNSNGLSTTSTRATAAQYPITVTFTSSSDVRLGLGGSAAGAVFRYNASEYFRYYANCTQNAVYLYKKTGGYTGHTINCADCGSSVTPTYTAAPTGGTVSVTKSASPVTSGSTVKTCTAVDLTVTITPASHYTLTGLTATGLSTGTATISPAVNTVVPTTSAQTFTVTVSAGATGTLNLMPTLEEDAHKVITWTVHGGSASIADGHGTTWVYSGENLTGIPSDPSAPAGCVDKEFVGWSEYDGGATEGDASDYTDLFTTLGGAPTGITTNRTFYAVFATPAAGMGGTVMWDEPWTGATAGTQPSGTTGYNSTAITYSYSESGCKIYDEVLAGGTSPELLVKESGGNFTASNIPAAGQTSLTLTYKSNKSLTVSTNTTGVTVGDADVDGSTYTRTITIDQSGLGVANFDLVFTKTAKSNARLDDIHVVVPGSSSMSGYVTTCEDTWTVTYYKNTEDAVTNLPSPTGISKSTGSGTLSSKVPVRYGYTFDGWATSAGGSVVYAAGDAVSSVSADMDLYAKWSVTPVTEINLSKSSLDKYVGDPSVTLSVLSVLPDGASTSVNWSSSNTSVATVSASGEVNFLAVGTATITATSTVTNTTTATCVVTVWAKPTATFLDNMHGLTVDENSVALSSYNLEAAAGTAVVFPTLANQIAGSGTCEDEHYIFVGWTTSDNNDDPEDHLVSSYTLTNGDAITYYAVWADGVSGTTYVKLTDNSFSTSKHYVIGAVHPDNGTTYYFNSCAKTDKDNSWGYVTADLASDTPIEFTLSGTASALVATTTESTSRYLKPTSTNEFHMSSISQTIMLKSDGKIYSTDETRRLLLNKSQPGLRWYGTGAVSGTSNAYFYEVVAGGEVNYRTSCCADKVPAPTVTATQTSVSVTLNWNDLSGSGATGYEVSWNDGAWTSPSGTRTHSVSGLTPNTTYTWKVRATYTTPKCGADIASGSTTTNQVYHVTYAGGSGTGTCNATGSTTDATAYEAGATVTLQANGFTLVGHTFNEWTEDDEDITISSNQFTMPEHDVVITATWTPKVDKFYDRMHDGTDASHGGIADGDGKYYITREGCSYTVPSLTDNTSGATACHTKHYVLMGWTAESHLNSDGTLKTGHEGYVYTGGGTQTATGATYYAVWAEVEE